MRRRRDEMVFERRSIVSLLEASFEERNGSRGRSRRRRSSSSSERTTTIDASSSSSTSRLGGRSDRICVSLLSIIIVVVRGDASLFVVAPFARKRRRTFSKTKTKERPLTNTTDFFSFQTTTTAIQTKTLYRRCAQRPRKRVLRNRGES